jgi:quinol monooxygenase YgiN
MKVAIVTGASHGIGAGIAAGFRCAGYAVVATSCSIRASDDQDLLTVQCQVADAETAQPVVEQALERFGRVDTVINNAGIFIGKRFTDYRLDDYAVLTAENLPGSSISRSAPSGRWSPRAAATSSTSRPTGGAMVILRQKMRAKPDKSDELMAALAEIITPARATEGVMSLDIARVLLEPDSFIATAVYEDGAALERQESRPEVHKVMAMLPESLAAPLERTIFDASLDPALV